MMKDLKISEYSPHEFFKLESAWKELEKGKDMTPFQSFEWFRHLNNLYFEEPRWRIDCRWVYILIEESSQPALIAPVIIQKFGFSLKNLIWSCRGVYMIGRNGYSDYLNFIYRNFNPKIVQFLFDYLKTRYHQSHFSFENLLANTGTANFLLKEYANEKRLMVCVALFLPDTEESYEAMLSKSTRQNLRTAINRAKRDQKVFKHEVITEITPKIIDEMRLLRDQRLVVKKRKRFGEASILKRFKYFLIESLVWFRGLLHGRHDPFLQNTRPWALLIRENGKLVAFFWGIKNSESTEFYVIMAAVHHEYEWYSPGKMALRAFIHDNYQNQNGIKLIDFTRGGEAYKYELGGVERSAFSYLKITF